VRFPELTWDPWKKWVLDHLGADLVLCGIIDDIDNPFSKFAKHVFRPGRKGTYDMELFDGSGILKFGNGRPLSVSKMAWCFRDDLWAFLVEKGLHNEYDMFIISRTDILWTGPHPVLDENHIWCVNGEFQLGLNDRHMVIPRRFLEPALRIFHIEDLQKTIEVIRQKFIDGHWKGYAHCLLSLEPYIYCRFVERGLIQNVGLCPFPMYLTDAKGEARYKDELEADQATLTWPFTIIHNHISVKNDTFIGRAI
jgi:hypothetical protein